MQTDTWYLARAEITKQNYITNKNPQIFVSLGIFAYFCSMKKNIAWLMLGFWLVSGLSMVAQEKKFYVFNAANGLSDNSAQTINCTKTGRLVITTMGQINFFDGQTFTYIDPSTENIYPLKNYSGNYHLYFDRYHHLWLKDTHSVTCVNLTTERFVDSVGDILKEFGMEEDIQDLFVDIDNVVWLMTNKGLYCVESKRTYPIRKGLELQDMDVFREKYLLLFYNNGLMEVFDLKTGKILSDSRAYAKELASKYDRSSVLMNDEHSFFQLRNGKDESIMMKLDPQTWQWKTLLQLPYHMNNFALQDSVLYIPTSYGYYTYDLKTEQTTHVEQLQMATGDKLLTDINAMAFDRQGGMWVGTQKRGLLYARPFTTPFHVYRWDHRRAIELTKLMEPLDGQYMYKGKQSNCVYCDSRGWTWVGTTTGLQVYKKSSDNLPQIITRQDGLLNNVIHTIIEDDDHNIWVGTSYGISCLVMENDGLRFINSYNEWEDIPDESFVNGKSIRLSDGSIAMQMLDHVVEFNPNSMKTLNDNSFKEVYPKLIRLMVNGNVIRTGQELDGNVILDKALSRTPEINLNYNQNSVSLTFSALNYFRPQQTYYRVRVRGLDDTWRILTRYNSGGLVDRLGQLHLPLVSLKPGSYTVEVQTSLVPDKFETVPYEWVVNVNEPWWRTTGMMVLASLILLTLIVINAYYYLRNTKMRTLRNSQEQSVIKRIKSFAERSSMLGSEKLEAIPEEIHGVGTDPQNELAPEFMDMMVKLMPTVLSKDSDQMTMRELSNEAGMNVQRFYRMVMANIYKNPRALAKRMMIKKATGLLKDTEMEIPEIANLCGFSTPNYFIATFFHEKKMTPHAYRIKKKS